MKILLILFSFYFISSPHLKKFENAEVNQFYCDDKNKISEFGIPCASNMIIKFTGVELYGILNKYYTISGNVISDDSFDPSMPGVKLNLGLTKNGFCYSEYLSETDSLGNFEIKVPAKKNRFLEFKTIGFSTLIIEIPI
jgi:hypothetical protein